MGGFNQNPPQDHWDSETSVDVFDWWGNRVYRKTGFVPQISHLHRSKYASVGRKLQVDRGSASLCSTCYGDWYNTKMRFKKMLADFPHDPNKKFVWDWETYPYNPDVFFAKWIAEDLQLAAINFTQDWNSRVLKLQRGDGSGGREGGGGAGETASSGRSPSSLLTALRVRADRPW